MQILHLIATWAVAVIGTVGLVAAAVLSTLWLLDRVLDKAVAMWELWWNVGDAMRDFVFNRHKCTCGAVGSHKKAEPPGAP